MDKRKIYRDGFRDGMKNCGFLLIDIKDESVQLSDEWERTVEQCFLDRNYPEEVSKEWKFFRKTIIENITLEEKVKELRKLLDEANEKLGLTA